MEKVSGNGPRMAVEDPAGNPNPEVAAKPTRRRFSAAYKLQILEEAASCSKGELGALLRREGLYSSHLSGWRKQQEEALTAKKRGRRPNPKKAEEKRISELERENRRLRERLRQAEAVNEAQKKLSEILGVPLEKAESDESE